jgi:class 3 adenylate cyclase
MPPQVTAKIVVRMSDGNVHEHELGDQIVYIGRDPSCEIHIPSQYVSRRHARISPINDRFVLQDERSTNGLHINGRIVREPHPLSNGDLVALGDVSLTYEEVVEDPMATAIYSVRLPVAQPEPQPVEEVRHRVSRPAGLSTILFTDLVDHTREVTRLGDVAGQRWLRSHTSLLREQFQKYEGMEDKWTGDGFLVTFASTRLALHCTIAIQRALRDHNRENPGAQMHIRAGLHTGEILKEEDELFGNAVIMAARVMSRASADEILISELMFRLVQSSGEFVIVERGLFALKGFPQRQRLYQVKWLEEDQHALEAP